VNIANVRKVSDIATMKQTSFVKSSKDGLVYIWGFLAHVSISKPVVCEHTNVFDVCNSMMAQSPISMIREYTDQEFSILNDLENAFDDPVSLIFYLSVLFYYSNYQNCSTVYFLIFKRFKEFSNSYNSLLKTVSKSFVEILTY